MLKKLAILTVLSGGLVMAACGDSSSDDPGSTGTGGAGGSGGAAGAGGAGGSTTAETCDGSNCTLPPEDPGAATPGANEVAFGVSKIYLGDTDRDDTPNPLAWKTFGYNLDNVISKKSDSDHCTPAMGANPAAVKTDGEGGIDNSFGSNLMPIITGLAADAAQSVNDGIAEGDFTIMVYSANMNTDADQSGVSSKLYAGAKLGAAPLFDGSDVWPVTPEGLTDATDIEASQVLFPNAFVAGGVWVSGGTGTVALNLAVQGAELALTITNAVISANISDASNITDGTIAGVLETEVLIEELRKIAGGLDPNLCSGSTFESIAQQIRAASDIMVDGTNGAGATCNGISIGLGFDAKPMVRGAIAPAAEPGEDPCAEM